MNAQQRKEAEYPPSGARFHEKLGEMKEQGKPVNDGWSSNDIFLEGHRNKTWFRIKFYLIAVIKRTKIMKAQWAPREFEQKKLQ